MSRLIVKNLPDQITKKKLLEIFSERGTVTDIQLKYTKDGKFRKFAYVGYEKEEMAEAAKEYLNKSFINTSRIEIETCTELGDPTKKLKSWSKHTVKPEKKAENSEKVTENAGKDLEKKKIKDPKVLEMLKNHKNDARFLEFLEMNVSEVPDVLFDKNADESEETKKDPKAKDEEETQQNLLANKDISDSEYIKLKTGVKLNLKETPEAQNTVTNDSYIELYTVKLSNVPKKTKKREIKEFLSPLKPYTIRKALKIPNIAYCGFKTEKEMKVALLKNKSFLNGKRIYVKAVKKDSTSDLCSATDKSIEIKWKNEKERVNHIEAVGESGRIFIRNIPYTASEEELKKKFEFYGPITSFSMPIDSFTRKPKGFAFVTYLIPEHACRAFNELDGTIYQGRMLHLIPGLPSTGNDEEINPDDPFKKNKAKMEKAKSESTMNWNTFFIGENALADAMASTYETTKEKVLADEKGGAAVRLALGETQLISKMKEFLEENDVCLSAFENMSTCKRSNTVILVKNLPFGTKAEELREKFAKFGPLKRIVLPPTGIAALVEFIEPFEAKKAFRRLSYSKFRHVPLYLEWAPEKVFLESKPPKMEEEKKKEEEAGDAAKDRLPVEGATIFVKNLNFSTEVESLRKHFSSCGNIVSAWVPVRIDPNDPSRKLSAGYGFVEFADKSSADTALKTLQFSMLDDHRIELKRSNRTMASTDARQKTTQKKSEERPSTKILVRNVPFQATQREVADLFKVFGELKAVRLPRKMVGTGSHRGFCFVEYNTVQDAKRAFAALSQSTHLYGRRLVLEWASNDEDDVDVLRKKTKQQFETISAPGGKRKKITVEESVVEEED